jgi:hypothetical protein
MVSYGADHVHVPYSFLFVCIFSDLGGLDPSLVMDGLKNVSDKCFV